VLAAIFELRGKMRWPDTYSKMSDDELLHVATDRSALRSDALPFLEAELNIRGLSVRDVEEYQRHLAATPPGRLPRKEELLASSFNGFGTAIYGKRDFWSDGSYIATKWVVLFGIPLVPLGSMRLKKLGPGSGGFPPGWSTQYLVCSREQLNLKQVMCVYLYVVVLIGGFVTNPYTNPLSALGIIPYAALALPWALRRRARLLLTSRSS
jgi:hypothetical protein